MQISRSQYRAVSDILDLPCFAFLGEGVGQGRISFDEGDIARHLLKVPARPFAQAILGLAASVGFGKQRPEIIQVPRTIFGFDPTPTVFTIPSAGIVKINLGMYLSVRSMSYTISWLQSIYGTARSIGLDDIKELAVPQRAIDELERVLLWWHRYQREGKVNIGRILESMTSQEAEAADTTTNQIFYFVTFHEFAHWFGEITPLDAQRQTLNKMRSYLASWPAEDVLTPPETKRRLVEVFRGKQPMFENWVQELHADSLAVQFCLDYFRDYFQVQDRRQVRLQVFAAQALTYSLLIQLTEVFPESVLGRPVSWRTHPPSGLRANIFCHVGGKIRGTPQAEFAATDWGVGTFIGLIMERVMNALRSRIGAV
jgi:hypothetical protein